MGHESVKGGGINSGPVVAGVIGTKRFLYDLWGDAVAVGHSTPAFTMVADQHRGSTNAAVRPDSSVTWAIRR